MSTQIVDFMVARGCNEVDGVIALLDQGIHSIIYNDPIEVGKQGVEVYFESN